ncbi:MAG TPA: glycosyltransferase, partial [Sumerlaeia bacterium]|nr:glycosyltransferase [Sumerlaeia bacterium]
IGYQEKDEGQYEEERDVDYVTGAGLAVRREFLDLCGGGLDEGYFPAYCEEVDLCYRARLMGYRVVYAPRAVLVHHESAVLENQSPLFQRLDYRNRVLFCLKNYRLREWLFDFLPYEIDWLRAPWSKGLRKKQLRAYFDALRLLMGHRSRR